MDKTIKINLSGSLFQIDEDAYHLLRDYLQALESRLKNTAGGNETLDDLESRIAEIFLNQKGLAGIITKENVEEVISTIGKPEDFEQGSEPKGASYSGFSGKKRLYRSPEDTIIGGVCGGLGAYLNTDPVWIRLLFIILFFAGGLAFFAYLALWIALPAAHSDSQKRELYGSNYSSRIRDLSSGSGEGRRSAGRNQAGNALNEIFRAVGTVFFVIFRIFAIAIGVTFVLAGFATLVTFIMTFFFRYPWFFFDKSLDPSSFYLPDFLNIFIRPEITPWIIVLISIVVILPLLAFIYWGIRMIFWLKVKDWLLSLSAFVIWVIAITALSIISFTEGIGFAENGNITDNTIIENRPDTLYIRVDGKISSLKYDHEFSIPDNEYSLYINKEEKLLYGRTELNIYLSESDNPEISVERYSNGRSRREAMEKAEKLIYKYSIKNDTIVIDQYYTVPPENKWAGSWVEIDIRIPEGTVIWIDREAEILFDNYIGNNIKSWELGNKFWRWEEDGPSGPLNNEGK
jgi:phage shock protein PspC (stress-responsive transcriptional regulator)